MVSGAHKTVTDLEQLSTADADALIDSIEALLQEDSSTGGGGTGSGLADPVLSKSNGAVSQGMPCYVMETAIRFVLSKTSAYHCC